MNATTNKKARMYERIRKHGEQLLAIFPRATERDPVKLCKRLRRLEAQASAVAVCLCNGLEYPVDATKSSDTEFDLVLSGILDQVNRLLGNYESERDARLQWGGPVHVFINRDPRGYALKIRNEWMTRNNATLARDWGGYGILAPDFSAESD